jgi:2-isopropylmalate synthase
MSREIFMLVLCTECEKIFVFKKQLDKCEKIWYNILMANKLEIYDTTLRDGAQGMGVSYSIGDKIKILEILSDFGVDFVECGNAFSNPKDKTFFNRVKNSKIVVFGSTNPAEIPALLSADTEYVSVFGKASSFHTEKILGISKDENLKLIHNSVSEIAKNGKKVFFLAEHFFDGYRQDPEHAVKTLQTAFDSGAMRLVLCDTNGGTLPHEIAEIVGKLTFANLGIHCHNDADLATAGTLAAVNSGVVHVQGTFGGTGERCGNADLSAILPNLALKMNYETNCNISKITETAHKIAEISNIKIPDKSPYVGAAAFAHKAGMHADGVVKCKASYEHIPPEAVGNKRNLLISEISGRALVIEKIKDVLPNITKEDERLRKILDMIKANEHFGYQYESAEASFELLVKRAIGEYKEFFNIKNYKVICEKTIRDKYVDTAVVKIKLPDGEVRLSVAEGNGPVNALYSAIRKTLKEVYPRIKKARLTDYKVRILDGGCGTAAPVRVLMESSDGEVSWTTVGVSEDIVDASIKALKDSLEWYLFSVDHHASYNNQND